MKKALFISNVKYIDTSSTEGGVKFCTREYIDLLKTKFEVVLFPVQITRGIFYRLKKKLGIDAYEEYEVNNYMDQLTKVIEVNKIDYVFLNLSNTVTFSAAIKKSNAFVKIILCSHGNESGDFLHDIVLHKKLKGLRNITARYALGKMLSKESLFRKYIDLVLTVSDVELNIEKWLGAKKIYMVPRTLRGEMIHHYPVKGRVGFFGDLSHAPNFYGIKKVCEAINNLEAAGIELRLVSSQEARGEALQKEFSFVTYLGYLPDEALSKEAATWTFCLNPVFYYSRGVSTKLGKALGMGVPVITSKKGMRGYLWKEGEILSCDTEEQMANLILKHASNTEDFHFYRDEILKMRASSPTFNQIINDVCKLIESE